jgi:hypothetical protein
VDFLAVTSGDEDSILGRRAHVEVQVAAYSRAIGKSYWPPSNMAQRFKKKFDEPHVKAEVTRRLGEDYRRVLVLGSYGRTKPDRGARRELIKELKKLGITVIGFENILEEVQNSLTTASYTRPALRMIQHYKFIPKW